MARRLLRPSSNPLLSCDVRAAIVGRNLLIHVTLAAIACAFAEVYVPNLMIELSLCRPALDSVYNDESVERDQCIRPVSEAPIAELEQPAQKALSDTHDNEHASIEQILLEQHMRRSPEDPESYVESGWSHFQMGQISNAKADLSKAIKLNPKSSEARCKRAWVYITARQFRKALKDANWAIALDRTNVDAWDARENALEHLAAIH